LNSSQIDLVLKNKSGFLGGSVPIYEIQFEYEKELLLRTPVENEESFTTNLF